MRETALANPIRQQILAYLQNCTPHQATTDKIALDLSRPVSSISYHASVLADHGFVQIESCGVVRLVESP